MKLPPILVSRARRFNMLWPVWASLEKKTPHYRERDDKLRTEFERKISVYPHYTWNTRKPECSKYICHKLQRTHGYSPKGTPIHGLTYGKRKKRSNIIGGWTSEAKLFATQCFEETINKERFITMNHFNLA